MCIAQTNKKINKKDAGGAYFPPNEGYTIKAIALDSSKEEIVSDDKIISLVAGENLVSISLSSEDTDLYWVICGNAEGTENIIEPDEVYDHGSFLLYINGN